MVDITWPEVEKAAKQGTIILLPTAAIEEHAPHMGCGIDMRSSQNKTDE
jgi:creatinine amidohydrolase/Fe(II)-dependent formamide hydrolase-like protein